MDVRIVRAVVIGSVLLASSCVPFEDEDGRVCANAQCPVGFCYSDHGQPACACSAWELAAGLSCTGVQPVVTAPAEASGEQRTLRLWHDQGVIAQLDSEATDRFDFQAGPGQQYTFSIANLTQDSPITISLVAADGSELGSASGTKDAPPQLVLQPEATGTLTFVVHRSPASTGYAPGYGFDFRDLDLHDASGDLADAGSIGVGTTQESIEPWPDVDAYRFSGQAYHVYQFSISPTYPYVLLDTGGQVMRNPGGSIVDGVSSPALIISRPADWTGFVYLRSSGQTTFEPYAVTVAELAPDTVGNTPAEAQPITPGVPISARMDSPEDVDMFSFDAQPGHYYLLQGLDGGVRSWGTPGADSYVYAADGGSALVTIQPSPNRIQDYAFVLNDVGPDEAGPTLNAGTQVAVGETITGNCVPSGDVDVFWFTPMVGEYYALSCPGACRFSFGSTPPSASVQVTDSNSVATYYVKPASSAPIAVSMTSGAPYQLTIADAGWDDYPDSPADAVPISIGEDVTGVVELQADQDQFAIGLDAGAYQLTLSGTADVAVDLGPPDGVRWFSAPGGTFTAPDAGTYPVTAADRNGTPAWHLTYGFQISPAP